MDNSQNIIIYMIFACVIFMFVMIFYKYIKIMLKIALQGIIGLVGIFFVNFITAPFGVTVGINVINGVIIGILGIPGFICLYVAKYLI